MYDDSLGAFIVYDNYLGALIVCDDSLGILFVYDNYLGEYFEKMFEMDTCENDLNFVQKYFDMGA